MDPWKSDGLCQSIQANGYLPQNRLQSNSLPESSQQGELEVKDSITARKVQKADREKLRRDRLNEQFLELGNALDPDRPKNDKATILTDTIQMLKDLTAQVNRLKAEYASLSEESRELTQEKNELREEKAALKSDIDNLSVQYQQRLRVMFPWAAMDPSVVMGPPAYPFPMPVPVPAGPIPVHPSLQPYPFFRNLSPGAMPNPCSTFLPFSSAGHPQIEQQSTQYVSPHPQLSRSHNASKQDSRSKSSDRQRGSNVEKSVNSIDVVTELELKTPGSASSSCHVESVPPDQDLSSEGRKGKQRSSLTKGSGVTDESCSSRSSSSCGPLDSSSNSAGVGR
ncbi:transcription factor bHLH121 isoform X2 [Magnolia sinica]|uniref:transcription factor bHLH121 isoform X2 n=1 Tax=Magnolia sinica TaxID=86752 RepID=UPI00265B23D8|nr:transcription factor bHLH121 isoform X2 [Magnolia sinica]